MVGIVILNYNSWNETMKILKSLFFISEYEIFKVYLIDNNSETPMPKELKQFISKYENRIIFVNTKNNLGYNYGNNRGIQLALKDECDFILVSNNDIIFQKNTIRKLITFMQTTSKAGIVAPLIKLGDDSNQEINMRIPTTLMGKYLYILRKTPLKFISNSYMKRFSYRDLPLTEVLQVSSVSGACFMLSKECAKYIYPLDEVPFLYEEEIILGWQLKDSKYKTYILPSAQVEHVQGASTHGLTGFSFTEFVRSEMYYCRVYLQSRLLPVIPLYVIRCSEFLVKGWFNSSYRHRFKYFLKRTVPFLINK